MIGQFVGVRIKLKGKKGEAEIFQFMPATSIVVPKGFTLEIYVKTIGEAKTVVYVGDV